MGRAIRALLKVVLAAFLGLTLDGIILRDPWVELGNGYNIVATSWGEPCHLTYYDDQDSRPPAVWSARRGDGSFAIRNRQTHECREYNTEEEWKAAIQELNARPSYGQTLVDHVTAFDSDRRFAIGSGDDGCFLLDKGEDDLELWTASDEWAEAVRSRTGLDPDRLRDPKAWHLQYRHPIYWTIMGPYLAMVAFWVVIPLVRLRSGVGQYVRGTIGDAESTPP